MRRLPPRSASSTTRELVSALDIGASTFVRGPKHAFDIDIADLQTLLAAVASLSSERGQRCFVQLPGRCLRLTDENVGQRRKDIRGRPRLRLLIAERDGRLSENIAIELWKQAGRAYRSLSDDAPVRLSLPDAPAPARGPAAAESSVDLTIDVVYTWVDSEDPAWRELAAPYVDLAALDDDLFTSSDELRYSLRSIDVFAPWVNHVYVVTNCAPPDWFRAGDRISWIAHEQVAPQEVLPLFNSGAIDTLLHHVPGLAEHFLYLNDDVLLWDSVTPATFFTWDGRSVSYMAPNSSVVYLQQLAEAGRASASQHSRVNAARLLEDRLGVFPTRLHGHVPHALRRSVLLEIEREFHEQVEATRASRVRRQSDLSIVAYLYHHYADATGRAVQVDAPPTFVTRQNYRRKALRRALMGAPFACFQDSRGSARDEAYQTAKRAALERALPLPSFAEAVGGAATSDHRPHPDSPKGSPPH